MKRFLLLILSTLFFIQCNNKENKRPLMQVQADSMAIDFKKPFVSLTEVELYDKVLGTLVGSAIGDALGAPTEMWARSQIKLEYGFVDSLDNMIREPSPEGTWDYNLPAGGTTDDTRWKVLIAEFFLQDTRAFYQLDKKITISFANYLVGQYQQELEALKSVEGFEPDPFEQQMRRVSWLQEWALVARPLAQKDMFAYNDALSKFYGGEMVCAGLLYAPLMGIFYPNNPNYAYEQAYNLSVFDLGYARDITALNAAMVAAAFKKEADKSSVTEVLKTVDPKGFFKSRLVGRSAFRVYREALIISDMAKKKMESSLQVGEDTVTAKEVAWETAFSELASRQQDYPFHAAEIHLINLTALLICDFAFRESLAFVVNYGRDNDTVAAVTGTVLGAFYGYEALPKDLKLKVLTTNKEKLGIDLQDLAARITEKLFSAEVITKTM